MDAGPQDVDEAVRTFVRPAVDLAGSVLSGMVERGSGTLLFVTGLSAVVPLPMLGALVVGGLIERGDIYRQAVAECGESALATLDPDVIAEAAAGLAADRSRAEVVFDALTQAY